MPEKRQRAVSDAEMLELQPVKFDASLRIGQRVVFAHVSHYGLRRFYDGLLSPNSQGYEPGPNAPGPAYLCCIHPSMSFWLENAHDASVKTMLVPLSAVYEHPENIREDALYIDPETVFVGQRVSFFFDGLLFDATVHDVEGSESEHPTVALTPSEAFWASCPRHNTWKSVSVPRGRLLPPCAEVPAKAPENTPAAVALAVATALEAERDRAEEVCARFLAATEEVRSASWDVLGRGPGHYGNAQERLRYDLAHVALNAARADMKAIADIHAQRKKEV